MRRKIFVFIIAVVISAFLIFAGCTTGGGGENATLNVPSYETLCINPIPEGVDTNLFNSDPDLNAYALFSLAKVIILMADAYMQLALTNWDETFPSEYSEGGITVNWSHSGNTWIWEWSAGIETLKLTVTRIDAGWTLEILLNGETLISESLNDDCSGGTVTLYADVGSGDYFVVAWEPASSPYTITVTTEHYENDALTESLTLSTNADGSIGEWVYDDVVNGENDGSGSWSE